jgi:hypothetical protein
MQVEMSISRLGRFRALSRGQLSIYIRTSSELYWIEKESLPGRSRVWRTQQRRAQNSLRAIDPRISFSLARGFLLFGRAPNEAMMLSLCCRGCWLGPRDRTLLHHCGVRSRHRTARPGYRSLSARRGIDAPQSAGVPPSYTVAHILATSSCAEPTAVFLYVQA